MNRFGSKDKKCCTNMNSKWKKPKGGVAFWNRMISLLNYRIYTRLSKGIYNYLVVDKDFQTKKPTSPEFTWQNIADTARLFIENGGIGGSCKAGIENSIYIHLDIARAFNLVVPKTGKATARDLGYQPTSLVEAKNFRDPVSHVVKTEGDDSVWDVFYAEQVGFKPEGNVSKSKFLRFHCSVNWYLSELGYYFQNPAAFANHCKRTWYVYSDPVQTQLVGGSEIDVLRKVVGMEKII